MIYYTNNKLRGLTMKNYGKHLVLAALLVLVPLMASAEVTVKDTTSYEFIRNQGYSDEVHRIIEVKTKDPATPVAKEDSSRAKRFVWYLRDTINPSVNRPNKFADHYIDLNPSLNDL